MCTMICNDTWHTVAPYLAALEGAQALLVPASSARGTLQHHLDIPSTWMCMNRTYSATMGFYTVFVNRVGLFRGRFPFWGGSEIIGPRGEVVVQAPLDREALVIGEIDLNRVRAQRRAAPILRDAPLGVLQQAFTRSTAVRSEPLEVHREALPLGRNLPPSEPPARKGADA
jgi:predicted amidohydrolase